MQEEVPVAADTVQAKTARNSSNKLSKHKELQLAWDGVQSH